MLKKILAGLVTAVLSLGAVALLAGPASAHHTTISAKVTCATDGSYKVTWSVQNSESGKTAVITASSLPAVVPVGTTLGFSETKQFVQTVTDPQTIELVLTAFWDGDTSTTRDDVYHQDSGKITKNSFPTGCIKVTPEATMSPSVCTGPNQYTDPTYTLKAVTGVVYTVNGSQKAAGTYPATNGTTVNITADVSDPKYKIEGTSSWSFTFAAPSPACTQEVTPVKPSVTQQQCTGPGDHTLATFTIPAITGVLYSVKFDGGAEQSVAPGTHDIPDGVLSVQFIAKADAANYYSFTGDQIVIYPAQAINPAGTCLQEVTPKKPSVSNDPCDVINAPGVVPPSTYTLYYVEHVVYEVSTDNVTFTPVSMSGDTTFTVAPGTHIFVRATVDDPSKFQAAPFAFDHQFVDRGDCKSIVTPVAPSWTNEYCDDSDPLLDAGPGASASRPAASAVRTVLPGTVTIYPADNVQYYLDGVPIAPGTYTVSPGDHVVTISFDASKFKLADGVTLPFTGTVLPGECLPTHPLLTPLVVSSQMGCFTNGSYTLSNDLKDADAVIWTVNGSQVAQGKYTVATAGTVQITATPNAPDYGFAPGVQTSWTVDFKRPAVCDTETLAFTGQSPTGLLVAADAFVVAGLAMFAMRSARRDRKLTV